MPTASEYYCQVDEKELLTILDTNFQTGLTNERVSLKTIKFGKNELEVNEKESLASKILDQIKNPLIMLLLSSSFISILLGQYDNAFSITFAVIIVITVAFIQEYRSEKSLQELNKLVPHYCHVKRDSKFNYLLANVLVPGDIVSFGIGDRIPADIRILTANSLEIDESMLTGENKPTKKSTGIVPENAPLIGRKNIAFMGTLVRNGNGYGVVVATGKETEFGHVFSLMKDTKEKKTPLQNKMDFLGQQLSYYSFIIISIIGILGLLQHRALLDIFTISVTIPEGLPIVVTVTLALGVIRLSKENVIVRNLLSVESLGSVNVLCIDKTGTLTMNKMTISNVYLPTRDQIASISQLSSLADDPILKSNLQAISRISNFCNYAYEDGANDRIMGNSVDCALLEFALNFNAFDLRSQYEKASEQPFSSDTKYMSVSYILEGLECYFVKGAPEVVLQKCKFILKGADKEALTASEISNITYKHLQLSNQGLRVLAVAYGSAMENLTFAGLLAMHDPPRKGVKSIIKNLIDCGLKIIMITGDSKETAISIAKKCEIPSLSGVVSAQDLDKADDTQLLSMVNDINILYRATPKDKVRIVAALQANRKVVGMTGDGVNDAPSLKLADVGISMGHSGSDVSKEASNLILVNDDLNGLLTAIKEGKRIFYNIRAFLRFQLSTSLSALFLIALSTVFGLPNPLNAMEILWINIIMDGPPAQSLGVEAVDPDVLSEGPRDIDTPILTKELIFSSVISATVIVTCTLIIFAKEMTDGTVTARDTTMTFTCFVLCDMFNAVCCRSETKSAFELGPFTNKPLAISIAMSILGQLLVIYTSFFQKIFQTEALSLYDLLTLLIISSSVLWIDEARKWYIRRQKLFYSRIGSEDTLTSLKIDEAYK